MSWTSRAGCPRRGGARMGGHAHRDDKLQSRFWRDHGSHHHPSGLKIEEIKSGTASRAPQKSHRATRLAERRVNPGKKLDSSKAAADRSSFPGTASRSRLEEASGRRCAFASTIPPPGYGSRARRRIPPRRDPDV